MMMMMMKMITINGKAVVMAHPTGDSALPRYEVLSWDKVVKYCLYDVISTMGDVEGGVIFKLLPWFEEWITGCH